jgi:hypothetical protein
LRANFNSLLEHAERFRHAGLDLGGVDVSPKLR